MSNSSHHPYISQVVLLIEEGGPEVATPSLQVTERSWLFDPETFDVHEIPPEHDEFINAAFQKQGGIEIDELTIGPVDDDSGAVIRAIHSPRATRAGAPSQPGSDDGAPCGRRVTPRQTVTWDEMEAVLYQKEGHQIPKGEPCIDADEKEYNPGMMFHDYCNECLCWGNKLYCINHC